MISPTLSLQPVAAGVWHAHPGSSYSKDAASGKVKSRMGRILDGQVAIITGGARGIGRGIAERLARDGARVVIWDRDLTPLAEAGEGFRPTAAEVVDVASYPAVERAFNKAVETFGRVDILVNNAGINGPIVPTWDYPLEDWDRVVAIDMTAVFYGCRVAARHMRERRYGRIITVASIAGKEGVANISAYSAAKAGVIGFSKALAKELCDAGVTVNCIAPAMTETDLLSGMTEEHIRRMREKIPMGRFVKVEEVAAMAAFIASPDCSFTTGFVFDVTGGRATY
jgi:NAD(P)-dependent dehydrogenase (short-subunit alcohol dehydrogenase family)